MHAHNFVLAFDASTKCSSAFAIWVVCDYFPANLPADQYPSLIGENEGTKSNREELDSSEIANEGFVQGLSHPRVV